MDQVGVKLSDVKDLRILPTNTVIICRGKEEFKQILKLNPTNRVKLEYAEHYSDDKILIYYPYDLYQKAWLGGWDSEKPSRKDNFIIEASEILFEENAFYFC